MPHTYTHASKCKHLFAQVKFLNLQPCVCPAKCNVILAEQQTINTQKPQLLFCSATEASALVPTMFIIIVLDFKQSIKASCMHTWQLPKIQ